MKELSFNSLVNRYGEKIFRLVLELKENHRLIIETCEDNYKCDLYFSDQPKFMCPKNTVFYFGPCKWGNHHGVLLRRKLKLHFNKWGELTRSEYPIVDTPETIRKVMLKWAKGYVKREYA